MLLIEFSISNVVLHLAGKTPIYPEDGAVLHIFTSEDLGEVRSDRSSPILENGIVIDEHGNGNLEGTYQLYLHNANQLKESSSIAICLYAHSVYDNQKYLVPCGAHVINIASEIWNTSPSKTIKCLMIDPHSRNPLNKGQFTFRVVSLRHDIVKPIEKADWMVVPGRRRTQLMEDLNDYILRMMSTFLSKEEDTRYQISDVKYAKFRKYEPSHPGLKKVHCPFFQTDFLDCILPGFAYSWQYPRSTPNEEYFINLIRCALDVYEMDESTFVKTIQEQFQSNKDTIMTDFKLVLDVIAGACCLYSQGKLYVPDHVNSYVEASSKPELFKEDRYVQSVENMGIMRVTNGDDCEGMGLDNLIVILTLRNYDGWTNVLTKSCHDVLNEFCPILPHGAVTTASASDYVQNQGKAPEETDFIAHIFAMLIPNQRMKKMLERTGSDLSLMKFGDVIRPWNGSMDILFCEGTGRISPSLKPEWEWKSEEKTWVIENVKSQIDFEKQNTSFSKFSIMQTPLIAHPKNTFEYNSFYRYVIGAYIPRSDFKSVGDISFVYSGKKQYGVLVHDLVYDVDEPGLIINEVVSPREKKIIDDCLQILHPVPQMIPRSEFLKRSDIAYLENVLGLKPWKMMKKKKHFGYFFSMEEIRENRNLIRFEGSFEAFYKYVGLDDKTAYIELCIVAI